MRSYDVAEISGLAGLDLNRLSTVNDKSSVGLYRDNGLAAINNADGPNLDRIRKDVIALFKEEGLSIIIETNLNERHLLDITFNLQQRNIFLFERLTNINAFSKHPSTIIKQSPKMISKRISDLSCNKEEFGKVKSVYQTSPKG